jgi:hypothetical protein
MPDARLVHASRFKAAGIHLALSAAIAAAVLWAMLAIWYPRPFFQASGGSRLLFILVSVDIVLGPTITLIIFDLKKKTVRKLAMDLTVIGVLQLSALAYGAYIMFEARPVYIVFVKDRFEVATAADIDPEELARVTRPEFRSLPWTGPRLVGAKPPADESERQRILMASVMGFTDMHIFPQLYVPYAEVASEAAAKGMTLAKARELEPEGAAAVARHIAESGLREDDVRYLLVKARKAWLAAAVDAKSGAVLAFLGVNRSEQAKR